MKRSIILTVAFALLFSSATTVFADSHDDISGHYFESSMRDLIDQGILGGYGDGEYLPDRDVTRAEFTSFLVRSLNLSLNTSNVKSFTDVKEGQWYYHSARVASSHDLVGGYPSGEFKPNNRISREEMAVMIKRALENKDIHAEQAELNFVDEDQIQSWFIPAVQELVTLEIISGKADSKGNLYFAPKDNTTRGETSAILSRMLTVIEQSNVPDPDTDTKYTTSSYDYTFSNMINVQMNKTPKLDGAGQFIASQGVVEYYANPANFENDSSDIYQFLVLSGQSGLTAQQINSNILKGKGILDGEAAAFIEASKTYNVNEVYLIAHAFHETGNGTSTLAKGVGVDSNGQVPTEKNSEGKEEPIIIRDTDDPRVDHIVYNMYGYGAVDNSPTKGGAKYAFDQGWFTPADAIIGGAKKISGNYISQGQDTLYKMRWNPDSLGYHQYATHTAWATIQAEKIKEMFESANLDDSFSMKFDIPEYLDMPGETSLPAIEDRYHVSEKYQGVMMNSIAEPHLNLRSYPNTWANNIVGEIVTGASVEVIGYNGGWYKVDYDGTIGWAHGDFLEFAAPLRVNTPGSTLNVRSAPAMNASKVGSLSHDEIVPGIPGKGDVPATDGDWYLITYNGDTAYIHKDYVVDVKAEEAKQTTEDEQTK
ncbi:hypothetical protein E3U55_11285 [Filobacillus milosensis]|uniref:Beta-N-acetylglucosaminidase n=1 Tax=Filobacillus milosensis TaxID=94137 RepID=A0A4Y8IFN3_9BACI|nr:S-layer homology domain-containing protein [Filobacillus milosensis]TFB19287.1 hypothetical protein E3U55_11285 [Filobacillus milosensis]